MRTTQLAGHKVELYDGIDELPIIRFHAFNKAMLIDSGIGSTLTEWDNHIEKAIRFLRTEKPDLAEKELNNLRQNVYFIQSEISPKYLAFAALVSKIDGKAYNDMSPDGLAKVVSLLSDVPNGELTAQLEAVKKKIDEELELYYPKVFEDSTVKEYYDQLKQRAVLMLDDIIDGKDVRRDEIEDLTAKLITYTKPQSFEGTDSLEIAYDKQFENMCLILSQNLNVRPKEFTTLEYYNAFEYIKDMNKKQQKQRKRI